MSFLISIIVPCYNQAHFLDETLTSVLNQNYLNWECIIVNDGSPDNTKLIADFWIKKDKRFKYLEKENGGLSSARNFGIDFAKGDYIQFLDSDDVLEPSKFDKSMKLIIEERSQIVISNFIRFKKNVSKHKKAFCNLEDQCFNYESIVLNWDIKYSIPIHCGLFEVGLVKKTRFNEDLKAKEDWMFWIEFFKYNPKVNFINENLALYRMHTNGMTKNSILMEENQNIAYQLIYDSLDDNLKKKFFVRIINELSHEKSSFKNFKSNIFYRKFFNWLKNLLTFI